MSSAYDQLARLQLRLYRLEHLQSIAGWDQACNMPPKGSEARGAAMGEMASLLHRLRIDGLRPERLDAAGQEPLDELQRANLHEMRIEWQRADAVPDALVEARSVAASRCEHAWRSQRPANDWAGFLVNFKPLLELAREEAALLAERTGLSRYDALLQRFEPGMRTEEVERVFGEVEQWLPGLIDRVVQRQAGDAVLQPQGPFAPARQRALSLAVMGWLGFDFEAGRLDESTHPFSGGVPEDVRLTTRFGGDEHVIGSLLSTIHETGHACYEQNLPRDWLGQPVARARSMALHESQSLSFEMQLARSRPIVERLAPMIVQHLGDQPAFEAGNLHRLMTRVKPGLIRVDADEVTYPAHVILRFRIERALIEGEVEAEDIPALWDAQMQSLLGLDTRGNHRNGCLQDVHWPEGLFGYFPCYTLGAMYAAQWFATMRRDPVLQQALEAGEPAPVLGWLRERIWTQASRWPTDELVRRASGEPLNPAHFQAHLEARYLG